jgi:ABC-type lipoprotein export system ATPase subunit
VRSPRTGLFPRCPAAPLILADEPTANLDAKTGRVIVDLLHGLCREGRTVIVATHDIAIAGTADLVLEMEDGKIIREHSGKGARLAS